MQEIRHMALILRLFRNSSYSPYLSTPARTAQGGEPRDEYPILFVEARLYTALPASLSNLTIRHLMPRRPSERTHERLARVLLRVEPWANRFAVTRRSTPPCVELQDLVSGAGTTPLLDTNGGSKCL